MMKVIYICVLLVSLKYILFATKMAFRQLKNSVIACYTEFSLKKIFSFYLAACEVFFAITWRHLPHPMNWINVSFALWEWTIWAKHRDGWRQKSNYVIDSTRSKIRDPWQLFTILVASHPLATPLLPSSPSSMHCVKSYEKYNFFSDGTWLFNFFFRKN